MNEEQRRGGAETEHRRRRREEEEGGGRREEGQRSSSSNSKRGGTPFSFPLAHCPLPLAPDISSLLPRSSYLLLLTPYYPPCLPVPSPLGTRPSSPSPPHHRTPPLPGKPTAYHPSPSSLIHSFAASSSTGIAPLDGVLAHVDRVKPPLATRLVVVALYSEEDGG